MSTCRGGDKPCSLAVVVTVNGDGFCASHAIAAVRRAIRASCKRCGGYGGGPCEEGRPDGGVRTCRFCATRSLGPLGEAQCPRRSCPNCGNHDMPPKGEVFQPVRPGISDATPKEPTCE